MYKKNKSGQFYLVATIIIVVLFLSFATIKNHSIKRDNLEVYNYVDELKIEGAWILDYSEATGINEFEEFAKSYSYYVGGDKEIYFIYGKSTGPIGFTYEGEIRTNLNPTVSGGNVTINVEENSHSFELKPGQNFYFVMSDSYKDQKYIVTNIE